MPCVIMTGRHDLLEPATRRCYTESMAGNRAFDWFRQARNDLLYFTGGQAEEAVRLASRLVDIVADAFRDEIERETGRG